MTVIAQRTVTGQVVRPDLRLDRRRRRLSSVVARHADRSRPYIVSVHRLGESALAPTDTTVVLQKEMKDRLVGPKDVVIVTYLPRGGGGGNGSQLLMAVAAIALLVIAPYAVAALGVSALGTSVTTLTLAGKLLATGIAVGGIALMSMAMRPKANKQDDEKEKPIYGVSGGGNLPRPGDRIPRLYGRAWTTPDLSQADYFEYEGEHQILYKRLVVTLGKAQISKVRVNGQTMATSTDGRNFTVRAPFTGSKLEVVYPGETSYLVPKSVVSSPSVQGLELPRPNNPVTTVAGPFAVCSPGVKVNKIQLDVQAPQGALITYSNSKGSQEGEAPIGWRFEYRRIDDDGSPITGWMLLDGWKKNIKSKRPLRWTVLRSVTEGRYEVRGSNIYTEDPFSDRETSRVNSLQWDGLRGHIREQKVRTNVTELAIRIKSNPSLGVTSLAEVQVEATGIVPVWTGSAWVEQPTRKAVWAFADVMMNTQYGGAIPDASFDKDTAKWYADNVWQYDTFDGIIRGPDSVWNVASAVLFPLRAEPVQLGRMWSLVRDEPKTGRAHTITSLQIVSGSTGLVFDTDPDNGEAHIISEFTARADPKRPVELPPVIYGNPSITPTRRQLFGVATWEHALHITRWLSSAAFYRRQTVKFTTEHDGRIYKRGDRANVEVWFTKRSKPAMVLSLSGQTLTLDRLVPFVAGDVLVVRDRSGRAWGPVTLTGNGASQYEVVMDAASRASVESQTGLSLASALASGSMVDSTVLVGPVSYVTRQFLIRSAKPSGRDRIDVEAVIDSQAVWDAIEAAPSPDPYDTDGDTDDDILPPSDLAVSERLYVEAGEIKNALDVTWARSQDPRALAYEVEYRIVSTAAEIDPTDPDNVREETATDGEWQRVVLSSSDVTASILGLPTCHVDVRVRAVYTALHGSSWVEVDDVQVLGLARPPSDVVGFEASVLGDSMRLTWNPNPDVHLHHYEVRYSPQLAGVSWGSAVPLIPTTTATTEQVPAMAGTFLVKAVTAYGVSSTIAATLTSDVSRISKMNAVEAVSEQPSFSGAMSGAMGGVFLDSALGGLSLHYSEDVFSRSDWFAPGQDWFLGSGGVVAEGLYDFAQTVDLGAVFTSRVTPIVDAFGRNLTDNLFALADLFASEDFFNTEAASAWDVTVESRSTLDDPAGLPTWTPWAPLSVSDVTARAFQFRARLQSHEFGVTPVVTRLEVQVDMPDRHEGQVDLAVPSAGLSVSFVPPFLSLKGLGITAQGLSTGDTYTITSKSEAGFTIRFFNSSGVAKAASFDYVAVGYGRKE